MPIGIISHPDCEKHDAGDQHPERPDRVRVIQEAIKHYPFRASVQFYDAVPASREQLLRTHDEQYLDWLVSVAPASGRISIDEDTHMNAHTLRAALLSAGAIPLAVDLVMNGELQAAFCNIRPPGHHAEGEKAMGFCFFNNVAVGVMHAMAKYQIERVLIIDFDVHHGNGTQAIFQHNKKVMLCSSFEHPLYPGYEEEMDNAHIVSLPLPAGTTGESYRAKVQAAWFQKIEDFKPELIFISAGFDAHVKDPLANICLTKPDYVWLTAELAKLAKRHCRGGLISALEGGYNLEALAECVPAHIDALLLTDK